MHRFFVEEKIAGVGESVTLSGEESLHAARVLRLGVGEEIRLLDGQNLYAGELTRVSERTVIVRVTGLLPSPVERQFWRRIFQKVSIRLSSLPVIL